MNKKERRRVGDRKDGKLLRLRDVDGMHIIMPFILTNRTDNEAFISERIDITAIKDYLEGVGQDLYTYILQTEKEGFDLLGNTVVVPVIKAVCSRLLKNI